MLLGPENQPKIKSNSNAISFVIIPGMSMWKDHWFNSEIKKGFDGQAKIIALTQKPSTPFLMRESIKKGFKQIWVDYREKINGELKNIEEEKIPTFLVLHSAAATVGLSLITEKMLLEKDYFLGVVLINPHPYLLTDEHKNFETMRRQLGIPEILHPMAVKFLTSFPEEWKEEITESFIDYGSHDKVTIISGLEDDVVPPVVWNNEKFSQIRPKVNFVEGFNHFGGREGLPKVVKIIKQKLEERKNQATITPARPGRIELPSVP